MTTSTHTRARARSRILLWSTALAAVLLASTIGSLFGPSTRSHTTALELGGRTATQQPARPVPEPPHPPGATPSPDSSSGPTIPTSPPLTSPPPAPPSPTAGGPVPYSATPPSTGPNSSGPNSTGGGGASPGAAAPAGGDAGAGAAAPWWDIKAQTAAAINSWLSGVVVGAMTPIAQVGGSLLDPRRLTGISTLQQLWGNSRALANGLFGLLVLVGALLLAGHETVQTRWALKQIAPRIVFGFCAANLSWTVITASISAASALAVAVAGNGMTPGQILTGVLTASLAGGPIFTVILQITLVVVAVALVICLVVVGVLLMLLTIAAPLALCLHALPQTEPIAYLWWRAMAATLAIPVLQGLILALLARVVLQPGGYGLLGIPTLATGAGTLLNLLVTVALLWLMVTLPGRMWRLATGRPRGRGLVRGLVKTALGVAALSGLGSPVGAVLGLAASGRGRRTGRAMLSLLGNTPATRATGGNPATVGGHGPGRATPHPTAVPAGTGGRARPAGGPTNRGGTPGGGQAGGPATRGHGPTTTRRGRGAQPTTPRSASTGHGSSNGGGGGADGGWAGVWSRVRQTRSGQLILPLPGLHRVPPPRRTTTAGPAAAHSPTSVSGAARMGRQLSLFSRERLLGRPSRRRDGQLALPLDLTASPPPSRPPAPPSARGQHSGGGVGRQLSLWSPTALRTQPVLGADGQYRLPIPLTRTHRPPPTPPAPPIPAPPVPRPGAPGWQIALPPYPLASPQRRPRPRTPNNSRNSDPKP
jgi:hypothetical protein